LFAGANIGNFFLDFFRNAESSRIRLFNEFVVDEAASATKNGLPADLLARVGTVLYSVEGQVVQR
jgi:hypothetical protein